MAGRAITIQARSGNVFADLGLPDAAELDAKARAAVKINTLVTAHRLNQATIATRLKVSQPVNEDLRLGSESIPGTKAWKLQ